MNNIKRALLFLALTAACAVVYSSPPRLFTQPGINIIGGGCTTAFYIDPLCKPCGVGMRSSGQYPVVTGTLPVTGATLTETMGDMPDADPTDPTICTAAQWQAKWNWTVPDTVADNVAMCNFVEARLGYKNAGWNACNAPTFTGRIYYLSPTGNDTTAVINDPTHPYATIAGILGTPTVAGPLQATTQNFSGTGTVVSGSNIVTISGTCTGPLGPTDEISGTYLVAGTFIQTQLSGTPGCDGTYLMTANAGTGAGSGTTEPVTGAYLDGGVIVIRAGTWTTSAISMNPGSPNAPWELSGSEGYPLLIMAYPGERVEDAYVNSYAFNALGGFSPGKAACCVTISGLEFNSGTFYNGAAIKVARFSNFTVENSEFEGYDDSVQTAPQVVGFNVLHDVFHENAAHAVYIAFGNVYVSPVYASGECGIPAAQDFNFAADYSNYINGQSCGAAYGVKIQGNVIYDGGDTGLDPIHVNAWVTGTNITGNIVSYEGGSGIDLQSGDYNTVSSGNLIFDMGSDCFEEFLDATQAEPPGNGNGSITHRWNSFDHNVCYLTATAGGIWGGTPTSGLLVNSMSAYPQATFTLNSRDFTITLSTTTGVNPPITPGMVIIGTGVPPGTTLLPYGTDSTTGTGTQSNVTYAMSANATQTVSTAENIEIVNPAWQTISDTTFDDNIVVTTDSGGSIGTGGTNSIPFDFEYNSLPETNTIAGNTFWSAGTSSGRMMFVSANASTAGTVGAGAYLSFSGGTGCNASTGSFSNCFSGNFYANPNFPSASSAIYQTPGLFDFGQYDLR